VTPTIVPLGESALLVTLGDRVDREPAVQVHAATAALRAAAMPGVDEIVPAYTTLAVYFDRALTLRALLERTITQIVVDVMRTPAAFGGGRLIEVPTRYDGVDLEEVARSTGLDVADVIARHAERTYTAYVLGFAPGFAYLGDVHPALEIPRRATPRIRVPAGAVAIAGTKTAVYPAEMPGGWHLIGTTALVMFDPQRNPPALLAAGDEVRFVPVPS